MFKSYYSKDDHVILEICGTSGTAVKQPAIKPGRLSGIMSMKYIAYQANCLCNGPLLERTKSLVEGAGATALAALAFNDKIDSEHTGVIVGGNLDLGRM